MYVYFRIMELKYDKVSKCLIYNCILIWCLYQGIVLICSYVFLSFQFTSDFYKEEGQYNFILSNYWYSSYYKMNSFNVHVNVGTLWSVKTEKFKEWIFSHFELFSVCWIHSVSFYQRLFFELKFLSNMWKTISL